MSSMFSVWVAALADKEYYILHPSIASASSPYYYCFYFSVLCIYTPNRLAISKINCFHGHVCVVVDQHERALCPLCCIVYIATKRCIVDGECGLGSPELAPRYTYIYITSVVRSYQYYILQHRAFNSLYTSLRANTYLHSRLFFIINKKTQRKLTLLDQTKITLVNVYNSQ